MKRSARPREASGRPGWILALALAVVGFVWLLWTPRGERRLPAADGVTGPAGANALVSPQTPASPATSVPAGPSGSTPTVAAQSLDEDRMLPALKQWIKRREGKDVVVVESHKVHDAAGQPVSLNVLVTSLPGGLAAEELHRRLAVLATQERVLRDGMRVAYGQQDTQRVNRLAAEFTEARSAFMTTNQVSSYRVSLSKEDPPILAFWEGLTFEAVREPEARAVAQRTLGDTATLHQLVAYTSVAALLCFTNQAGEAVYVDPVRLARVSTEVVVDRGSARRPTPEDAGREVRIANQWREMLEPAPAGPTDF